MTRIKESFLTFFNLFGFLGFIHFLITLFCLYKIYPNSLSNYISTRHDYYLETLFVCSFKYFLYFSLFIAFLSFLSQSNNSAWGSSSSFDYINIKYYISVFIGEKIYAIALYTGILYWIILGFLIKPYFCYLVNFLNFRAPLLMQPNPIFELRLPFCS